jgi:hypothetical protein
MNRPSLILKGRFDGEPVRRRDVPDWTKSKALANWHPRLTKPRASEVIS